MKTKVIGYTRVSTNGQVKYGEGLDVQVARIKQYCHDKKYDLITIHKDLGVSGCIEDRPGLIEALAALEDGMADVMSSGRFWKL